MEEPDREHVDTTPVNIAKVLDRRGWSLCIVIALVFSALALRTVGATNIVDTDAARHAMNGVFLHDLIAAGELVKPIEFAHTYYSHLPSLSIPYHPPLFPLIEAAFFFVFGVSVPTARLVIAVAVAVSAILLFRLVIATHKSTTIAVLSTVTFLSMPYATRLGSDVMLEFPALVFTLLAIRCLWPIDTEYPMKRAVGFAALAGAAVWTKQHAVFLGLVPFIYFALIGRWRLFLKREIWISSALFGAMFISLMMLSLPFGGTGVSRAAPDNGTLEVFLRNTKYYISHYPDAVGPAGIILLIACATALGTGLLRGQQTALYVAWLIPAALVLVLIGPFTQRYLFFVYPALFVLGYSSLITVSKRWTGARNIIMTGLAVLISLFAVAWNIRSPLSAPVFLRGPEDVAAVLAAKTPKRILYCGATDGSFIFNYRSLREGLNTTIIAGAKLPDEVFSPAGIETFAHQYGVEYIVLERTQLANENRRWRTLLDTAPESMIFELDVPLIHSDERWSGILRVYRFNRPSPHPRNDLSIKMNMIGGTMKVDLKD